MNDQRGAARLALFLFLLVVLAAGFVCVRWYPYVFAKTIDGKIVKVERVSDAQIVTGRAIPAEQMFSFAVAIQEHQGGEIHTASSEDRQWAVAQPGQCARAKFFPYPPWELEKSGTYHGARLLSLYDCPAK